MHGVVEHRKYWSVGCMQQEFPPPPPPPGVRHVARQLHACGAVAIPSHIAAQLLPVRQAGWAHDDDDF
jgi:hypothetical protein